MNRFVFSILILFCVAGSLHGQATTSIITPLLQQHLQSNALTTSELRHFMLKHVQPLALPANTEQWDAEEARIRTQELSVIYTGWPKAWIDSAPKFERIGEISGRGYRIVKMRYEIIPGFESVALLYEPDHMSRKMPAILDVNGHGAGGKAVEQKQKRCINQARRGILALSIEFLDYGELDDAGNEHSYAGLLEMTGKNGMGLFYLAMRRGLDYLYDNPSVDHSRIGITGLSGGGWQSIVLGSLDTRIGPSAPDAGFSTLTTSIEHPDYHDFEQNAADVREKVDYAQLIAARAPRPTLLIYNAMDNCCFRADIVMQGVYLDIKPFFNLYGKSANLQWHVNLDPGVHNYGVDNREASYRFFNSAFHIDASEQEAPDTDAEMKGYQDLVVGGLPKDNFTILSLAQSLAKSIHHEVPTERGSHWAHEQQALLRQVIRYTPVSVVNAWTINATHEKGVESMAYRFEFNNGLSATGVLFRSTTTPETAPAVILFSDLGMPSTMTDVANQVNRGRKVLVIDPLFFEEHSSQAKRNDTNYEELQDFIQLLNGIGERSLGLEAGQINGVARWLGQGLGHGTATPGSPAMKPITVVPPVQIITIGLRSETVAMAAVATEPELFSKLEARKSIPSLIYAFDHPLHYSEAPELMCLDLYKDFDFNTLSAIASTVEIDLSASKPKAMFWN